MPLAPAAPPVAGGGLLDALGSKKLKKVQPPIEKRIDPNDALANALDKLPPSEGPNTVKTDEEWRTALTTEEYAVIRGKGTDEAHEGEYTTFKPQAGEGHFACRACKLPLYSVAAKFDSGCGWPAFDRCYEGSIDMALDTSHDMRRVELTCHGCAGHLGHIFLGEHATETDERHCVNSTSIKFVKGEVQQKESALAAALLPKA